MYVLFNFACVPFSAVLEEEKVITLPKRGKNSEFPQNLRPISLLSMTGRLFEKLF